MSKNQKPQRPAVPVGADAPQRSAANLVREHLAASAAPHGIEVPETIVEDLGSADGRRRTVESVGGNAAAQLAEKYGVDADSAKVVETAQSLATEDGRRAAMKELGVHMSGKLAEKYGLEDTEATKLLESSRALRTREGRQSLLAEYGGNVDSENLMARLHDRGLSIDDRRELVNSMLKNEKVTGTLKKAGEGLVIGAIVLLVVLAAIMIGAVALLSWLFQLGGGDASAMADAISTRPVWASFAGALGSA
jgi:hypothetical protein